MKINFKTNTIKINLLSAVGGGTGGGGNTNLSYTASPTDGKVNSDTGLDATLPAATVTNAGLLLPAEKTKLTGIEAGAEVNNISDANATDLTDTGDSSLHFHSIDRNRANHTGVTETITDVIAATSAGLSLKNNTSTDVAVLGSGGGTGTTFLGNVSMSNTNKITNTADPTAAQDVATKIYVDTGLSAKQNSLGFTAENIANKGVANGYAELDSNGFVTAAQLPSYVDDVLVFATLAAFPATGENGKIYVAENTNLTYRWSGSAYVEISASLALGETSSTAYRGDRGVIAYNHSLLTSGNPHNVTKADVGLGNVDNTSDANKPVSTATQTELNQKAATSHTHTASQVTDFNAEVTANTAVTANTNARHTRSHAITSASDHTASNHSVFFSNGAGAIQELALGADGHVLTSKGAAIAPVFQAAGGGASIFEKTVGSSGADYTTVGAAITAGFRRLLVITNVTETANITLLDNTLIMGINKDIVLDMGTNTLITGATSGENYTVENITIQHGNTTGGSLWNDNTTNTAIITLTDVILDNNATAGDVDSIGNAQAATRNSFVCNNLLVRGNRSSFFTFVTNGSVTTYFQANNLIIEGEGTAAWFYFDDSVSNATNNIAISNCIVRGSFSTAQDSLLYGGVYSNWTISSTNAMQILADTGAVLSNFQMTRNTPSLRLGSGVQLSGLYSSNTLFLDGSLINVSNIRVSGITLESNVEGCSISNFECAGAFTVNGGCFNNNFHNGHVTGTSTLVSTEHSNNYWNVRDTTGETPNKVVQIMRNTSGSSILEGSLVRLKSTVNMFEIEPCTTVNDPKFYGTVERDVANNAFIGVTVKGRTRSMRADGTINIVIGDWLQTSATSGVAVKCTAGLACAIALEGYTLDNPNGIIDALIVEPRVI